MTSPQVAEAIAVAEECAARVAAAAEREAELAELVAVEEARFRRWRSGFDWRGLVEWLTETGQPLAVIVGARPAAGGVRAVTDDPESAVRSGTGPPSEESPGYQPETSPTHPRRAARSLFAAPGAPGPCGSAAA